MMRESPHNLKERAFLMRFWELSNKDVINCKNGHRLGCVGDLEIDVCKLCITNFYVPTGGKYCGCLGKKIRI